MRKLTFSDVLFALVATVAAVLFVAMVLVVGGIVPLDEPTTGAPTSTRAAAPATEPGPSTAAATTTAAAATESVPATTTPERTPPALVVLTATRGDSWFSARLGSENGQVLDERVLAQGESVQFRARRIWLSVGAAGNVDVTVGGKPKALAPGTVSVVLTPPRAAKTSS